VPPVVKVWLEGQLPDGVGGKDVILALCGLFHENEALNHAIEFGGPGVAHLSIEARMTIANMSTEWGALAGVFPVDDVTAAWLTQRAEGLVRRYRGQAEEEMPERVRRSAEIAAQVGAGNGRVTADHGARYARELRLDLSRLRPYVVGPNDVSRLSPVDLIEVQKVAVHKAYIVSCVNSRASDLAAAAKVLEGRHVAPGVELYVAAASSQVQEQSSRDGHWQTLLKAGKRPFDPSLSLHYQHINQWPFDPNL
jgi:homoaconitate hydratase